MSDIRRINKLNLIRLAFSGGITPPLKALLRTITGRSQKW
jgi:hypothetical protein